MTIIVICLAIVVFMPLIAKIPLGISMQRAGGYDNKLPRLQQSKLEGFGARAQAAHENCFEATTYFAPTILLVIALNAVTPTTKYLAIAFVVSRLLYIAAYLYDWDKLRSVFWFLGMATIATHFIQLF